MCHNSFVARVLTGYLAILTAIFTGSPSHAQTQPPLTKKFANEIINQSVNTNTLFAYQDFISTGRFLQRRLGEPDTKYETFRLPAHVELTKLSDSLQPFVIGSGAILKVTSGVTAPSQEEVDDFSTSRLYSTSAGAGLAYHVTESISIQTALSLSYAYLRNQYRYNNSFSRETLQEQYDEFYNWRLHMITTAPSIRFITETGIGKGTIKYTLGFSQLFNNGLYSTSTDIDVSSSSGLLVNRLAYRHPLGLTLASNNLSLRPFFQWSSISGKAASGLSFVNMYEVGADLISKLEKPFLYFSEVYTGASYVSADSFEGWHLGVGGHF
jgi:hypothetical protein